MTFITKKKKSQSSLSKQNYHPNWDLDNLNAHLTSLLEWNICKLDSAASEMLGILKEK